MFFCISIDKFSDAKKEIMRTPLVALVTDYDSKSTRLQTQLHYSDDKRKCFSTSGLWAKESKLTRIEFAWDGVDAKGKNAGSFTVHIEVNIVETLARVLMDKKWLMLCRTLAFLTLRWALSH